MVSSKIKQYLSAKVFFSQTQQWFWGIKKVKKIVNWLEKSISFLKNLILGNEPNAA